MCVCVCNLTGESTARLAIAQSWGQVGIDEAMKFGQLREREITVGTAIGEAGNEVILSRWELGLRMAR